MSARSPVDEQHLFNLRARVAQSIARRAIKSAELTPSGVRVGVDFILSRSGRGPDDHQQCASQLLQVARNIGEMLKENNNAENAKEYLFVMARGPPHREKDAWPLVLSASSELLLKKAIMRLSAVFLGRVKHGAPEVDNSDGEGETQTSWLGHITEVGTSDHDKELLWAVVRSSSRVYSPDPQVPPPGARSASQLVAQARRRFERLLPQDAFDELQDKSPSSPVVLIDIRPAAQRSTHGGIPNAINIDRIALEFALDPQSSELGHVHIAERYDLRIILLDQDGSSSSLATSSLHDLGLLNATDIVGGYAAWKQAGLPTVMGNN